MTKKQIREKMEHFLPQLLIFLQNPEVQKGLLEKGKRIDPEKTSKMILDICFGDDL